MSNLCCKALTIFQGLRFKLPSVCLRHTVSRRVAVPMLVGLLILVGCATPAPVDPRTWREEVKLSDSGVVVVSRAFVPGEIFYNVSGYPFYRVEDSLELPDGTRWETKINGTSALYREPLVIDRDEKSWVIVMYELKKTAQEGLVYMRSSGNGWITVPQTSVPARLVCNLATHGQRSLSKPEKFPDSRQQGASCRQMGVPQGPADKSQCRIIVLRA